MSESRWRDVEFKYTMPKQEYIKNELEKFDKIVDQFCEISQIDKSRIAVNIPALKEIIIRVDMRRLYFQIYHSNMIANEYKVIVGLECFWILKLHPFWIQISKDDSEEFMHMAAWINEKIALHMVCCLLRKYNSEFFDQGGDFCESYCRELEYSFRYRDLSKESLFLMFDPFYFMRLRTASVTPEGKIII